MRAWLRFGLVGSLIGATFFLLGFFHQYHLPRFEQWLMVEIEKQSTRKLPVRIWPETLNIEFFPPSVVLNNVRLLPQKELAQTMAPAVVERAEVRINWFHLLTGRLRLSYVGASGADFKVVIKDNLPKSQKAMGKFDFSSLNSIPIDELELKQIAFWARFENEGLALRLSDLNLNLGNRGRSFFVQINAPKAEVKFKGAHDPMALHLAARGLLEEKRIQLSAFQIKAGKSFLVAAGRVDGGLKPDQWTRMDVNSRVQLDLTDIAQWERILRDPKLPKMVGNIKAEFSLQGSSKAPELSTIASGSGITVKDHLLGDFGLKAAWQDGILTAEEVVVESNAGKVNVSKLSWKPEDGENLVATVEADQLEIGQLLNNIEIKDVPIRIPVSGKLECKGPLLPQPEMECFGTARVRNLLVHTQDQKKKVIVALPSGEAKGTVKITTKAVTYQAEIAAGEKSKGDSSGVINYQDGFQISYRGSMVDIHDLKSLLGLKVDGAFRLSGTTEGTSNWARLKMNVDGKNVFLEDYWLGDVQSEVTYKTGVIQFGNLLGQAGTSRYTGQVSVNIPRSEISIQAKSPYADLADIREVFGRKVKLPFAVAGTGTVDVTGSGPLAFNEMSYELRSAFFRGSAAGETFDQLTFNVGAVRGQVRAEKVQAARGSSLVDLTGGINSKGIIDATVVGRKLRLEESENVSRLGFDVTGQVDLTMGIRGQLPQPVLDMQGSLSKLVIGDKPAEDSTFKLKISSERLEGGGNFMGNVLTADFIYPLVPTAPFKIYAKADEWNFGSLFSILSNSVRQRDIQTSMSAVVNLESNRGGPDKLNGEIEVNEFKLRRGTVDIQNASTVFLIFKDGVLSSKPFLFEGEGGSLRIAIGEVSANKINATVNGKLDLSLLTLLTPFLADLQGKFALNTSISGTLAAPQVSGSAFIEQGLVKFKEFPHAFTNIRSDILFSQQDVVINAIKADLAGGLITGDGKIRILGPKSAPVDVKGQFTNVTLNVPEGYKTSGSGTWSMKGPYFPYILGINYEVQSGEVISEFSGGSNSSAVTASALLPKFLVEQSSRPIHLDLLVQLKNAINVRNSLVQSPVRGRIRVVGPPSEPKLTGVLNPVPGGQVYFRDVGFEVSAGFLEYQDDPPENPKIYLTAQTVVTEYVDDKDKGTTENEYEINLMIQGRGRNPKITVSSLPALNEREIISLLALGLTPGTLQAKSSSRVGEAQVGQIGTSLIQKISGREMRNRLGVDVQLSQTTAESGSSPKVTINKQFSPKWAASAGRTIDKTPVSTVKMEYKVNRNLSVIGSWEGNEGASQAITRKDVTPSVFGLDLEYKVNFK